MSETRPPPGRKRSLAFFLVLMAVAALLVGAWSVRWQAPPAPGPAQGPAPKPAALDEPPAGSAVSKGVQPDGALQTRLGQVLDRVEQSFPGQAGIALLIPSRGIALYRRPDEVFPSASLVKVPILVTVYCLAGKGVLSPYESMTLRDSDRREGSGELKSAPAGTRYSVRQLAKVMIIDSDNTATDMLIRRMGMGPVNGRMRQLGLSHTTLERTIFDFDAIDQGRDNLTTPREMAALFSALAAGKLADGDGTAEMLQILKGQRRRDMIPAGLPAGIPVAHKTGELAGVLHDCGIIEEPSGRVILCLLGREVSDSKAAATVWADTARQVHAALAGSTPPGP